MNRSAPKSRWTQWIFRRLSTFDEEFACCGDMDEEFHVIRSERGRWVAWRWFASQALYALFSSNWTELKWSMIMIGSYFKISKRNIQRHKGYSFINITGLALGMACCLLILLFIQDEFSYDRFHPQAENIFRVVFSSDDDGLPTNANGCFGVGPAMAGEFPEVVESTRIRGMGQRVKRYFGYGERKFYEDQFYFAEPSLFSMFNFPLIEGDSETALNAPHSIVLTESMAARYFPGENPMGKMMEADPYNTGEMMILHVTGIMRDVPRNSHVHFNCLISYISQTDNLENFGGFWQHYTYVLLDDPSAKAGLEAKFLDFLHRHWREDPWYTISLQRFLDIRLHSHLRSEIEPNGNIATVMVFALVAVLILVIACINFINLTTARSAKRAKEVGLRKVVGANRKQLVRQFMGETITIATISGFFSLILALFLAPAFNGMADKQIAWQAFFSPVVLLGLLGVIVFVGLVSGSYISFVLSSFMPAETLRNAHASTGSGRRLREGLVVFQFVLSIALIISMLTVEKQMAYIRRHDTGYRRDEILVIPMNTDLRQGVDSFRNELMMSPTIQNVTTSSRVPTRGSMHNPLKFEGMEEGQGLGQVIYYIDKEFVDTYGMRIIAGENVRQCVSRDRASEFLISALTVREAGYASPEDALGKSVSSRDIQGYITGVVNDINLYSFHRQPYSITYYITPVEYHDYLSIRLDAAQLGAALSHLTQVWDRMIPAYPLDYFFLDESFEAMHRADQKLGEVLRYFSILSIFIAGLGLFGMAAFAAQQRTKEIGIRRTLGAPVHNIYFLLSSSFLKRVLLANLAAWPLAYFVLRRWLENFAYRTSIGVEVFFASTFAVLLVSLLTVSYQAWRAAKCNPVDSLKYE